MNDYKNTLNLPKTKFPMRGELTKKEPKILTRWYKENLYQAIRKAKIGKKKFILHDGPPYANGNIHIGHSVNKILKDIVIKSKGLEGFDSPYIPGWDCHGLPIEHKVEQIIGKPKDNLSKTQFRTACREYAHKQIHTQKKDFIRMGILGDWDKPYLTMDFNIEANTIAALGEIIKNGYLITGTKPVYWCTTCNSSLAEAEIEYNVQSSFAIKVRFKAVNNTAIYNIFGILESSVPIYAIIWTTTPWTLPANRAIAINVNFIYQLVNIDDNENIILAKTLVKEVMNYIQVKKWKIIAECNGSELKFVKFHHPFMNSYVPIIFSNHVNSTMGTGLIHIAPSHGYEDYIIGKEYKLEITNLVGSDGCYLPNTHPKLDGVFIFQSYDIIFNILINKKLLLHKEIIKHNFPYCWRHKTPIIVRTTPQWFISMEKNKLREKCLKEIKNIKWIPKSGYNRITNMVTNRQDWCISRQRTWGIPITLFIHKKTKKIHPKTLELIKEIVKYIKKGGVQAWWDLDPIYLLGNDINDYVKVTDTLDVWFDSGATHYTVVNVRSELKDHSCNMYLEGTDQHRGWFMSSIILSTAINKKAPFKEVLTHGFIVDEQGKKMSKSIGNTISPQNIINNLGADILRLWVASTDYSNEITISNKILKHITDNYRRIRNTARFLLANLHDFDQTLHLISPKNMIAIDRWAVGHTKLVQSEIIQFYTDYDFHSVVKRIIQFCSVEMGSFYLDIIKDRQYTVKNNSIARYSCQTALFHILEAFVRWISPILSFTADEIWQELPGKHAKYIFTEEYYSNLFELDENNKLNNKFWNILLIIRNEINKILEKARTDKIIHGSLEASITLYANMELTKKLNYLNNELCFVFLTSQVKIININEAPSTAQNSIIDGLKIDFNKAEGKKCPRCWHYTTDIGQNKEYKELCNRCITNIIGNGEKRKFV